MKLLVIPSSLDISQPFSATTAWWMLLKELSELGVDIIASPYQGPAIESLWWRSAKNPAKWQGDLFKNVRNIKRKFFPVKNFNNTKKESISDYLIRKTANNIIAPLWLSHIDNILKQEQDIDAVIFLTTPLNHLTGIAKEIITKYHKPVFYFDWDIPSSLPSMLGFSTGFRIYHGADLSEYTAFIINSIGGVNLLKKMGVKNIHTLFMATNPDIFKPVNNIGHDIDIFFYGNGREYRDEWIEKMISNPSRNLPNKRFVVQGRNIGEVGKAELIQNFGTSKIRNNVCRSKINLSITRSTQANLYGTTPGRPFELAAMESCTISNPHNGIELWFEPGKEIFVINSYEEAIDLYRYLLNNDAKRLEVGRAARERVLKQHTYRHRAQDLINIIQQYL
ncbi:MAG: glycosyltransferase [Alphaproteobacteria bacterium]|nr:glycosyltransferase [Alphaproteobacteria bacterium]